MIIIFFLVVLILSISYLVDDFREYEEINHDVNTLKEDIIQKDKQRETINWNKLQKINEDIIGWIKVKGTKIDYPILRDNGTYYINHSYNKKYNSNGSIFILDKNLCTNQETVIYGHNRMNGIMFSELSKYMEEKFFYNHLEFYIYTPNGDYKATIFSAYSININKEKQNLKFLDYNGQIEYYKLKSKYKVNNIKNIDKIVKLSTCSYLNTNKRPTDARYYIVAAITKV